MARGERDSAECSEIVAKRKTTLLVAYATSLSARSRSIHDLFSCFFFKQTVHARKNALTNNENQGY